MTDSSSLQAIVREALCGQRAGQMSDFDERSPAQSAKADRRALAEVARSISGSRARRLSRFKDYAKLVQQGIELDDRIIEDVKAGDEVDWMAGVAEHHANATLRTRAAGDLSRPCIGTRQHLRRSFSR